jgi:hypothetical protein
VCRAARAWKTAATLFLEATFSSARKKPVTLSRVLRLNRLAIRRICMTSFPRCTRNFTDSGKNSASSSVKISGAIAPVSSTLRQPWWGISHEEIAPPLRHPEGSRSTWY